MKVLFELGLSKWAKILIGEHGKTVRGNTCTHKSQEQVSTGCELWERRWPREVWGVAWCEIKTKRSFEQSLAHGVLWGIMNLMSSVFKMQVKAKPLQTCERGFDKREKHCCCLTNAAEAFGLFPVTTPVLSLCGAKIGDTKHYYAKCKALRLEESHGSVRREDRAMPALSISAPTPLPDYISKRGEQP